MAGQHNSLSDPVAQRRRRHIIEGIGLAIVVAIALFFVVLAFSK